MLARKHDTVLPYAEASNIRVTQTYGNKNSKYDYAAGYHPGLDLVSDGDKTIVAIKGGDVIRSQNYGAWGNYIVIHQDDELYCIYAHFQERFVEVGDHVSAGQKIGIQGSSGQVNGEHLHIEIQKIYYNALSTINIAEYLGVANNAGQLKLWVDVEIIRELEILKEGNVYWGCLVKRNGEYKALVELRPFAESNGQSVIARIDQGKVTVTPGAYDKLKDIKRIVQNVK